MASGLADDMDFQYQLGDEVTTVRLEREGALVRITIADRTYDVGVVHSRADELVFIVDGAAHIASIASAGSLRYVAIDGDVFELKQSDARRARRKQPHGEDSLVASMPGLITKVLIGEGDVVQRGQPLIVLEAMKMELKITAPHNGRVARILVQPGQVVDRGQKLVELRDVP